MNRRAFLQHLGLAAGGLASASARGRRAAPSRAYEFVFARLRYDSGDWDYNPKVCANVLDAVVQYTEIPVRQDEVVITLDSAELASFPFLFMTGPQARSVHARRSGEGWSAMSRTAGCCSPTTAIMT